jgi:hypothetical protein
VGTASDNPGRFREKRRFPRVAERFPVRFKVINERTSVEPYRTATTLDIGRGGFRFLTEAPLRVGDHLAVHLTMPACEQTISALAEVSRVKTSDPEEIRGGPRPDVAVFEAAACFLWSGWHDGDMQRMIGDYVKEALRSREGQEAAW